MYNDKVITASPMSIFQEKKKKEVKAIFNCTSILGNVALQFPHEK